MDTVDPVAIVTDVFGEFFGDCDVRVAERLLHPDYRHEINGRVFDRESIVRHVGVLKTTYRSISILPFDEIITEDDRVAVRYTVSAQRDDGELDRLSMMAFCTVADGRLAECIEVGYGIA